MFGLSFKVDVAGMEQLETNIKKGVGKRVVCGVPEEEQYDDGTSVAEVALIQEFGLVDGTRVIVPRPFMSTALKSNKKKYQRMMGEGIQSLILGESNQENLVRVGREMEQDIKLTIDSWSPSDPEANKAETVERKNKKNGNGQIVLIDSGKMRDSIRWWIEEGR